MVGAVSNDGEKEMEARLQADLGRGRGWQAKFKKTNYNWTKLNKQN